MCCHRFSSELKTIETKEEKGEKKVCWAVWISTTYSLLNHLLNDLVEEGLGEVLLDILIDVWVRRDIGDIGSEDAAFPVEDNRA